MGSREMDGDAASASNKSRHVLARDRPTTLRAYVTMTSSTPLIRTGLSVFRRIFWNNWVIAPASSVALVKASSGSSFRARRWAVTRP